MGASELRALQLALPDDDTTFWLGFSVPAPLDARSLARRRLAELGLDGSYVAVQEVVAMLDMSCAALRAKSTAHQALQAALDRHMQELEREKQAYAQVMLEEETLEEDSGFLKEQLSQLLKERQELREEIASLRRSNQFLLEERELVFDQLELRDRMSEDGCTFERTSSVRLSLTSAVSYNLEEQQRRRERLQRESSTLQATIDSLRQQQHAVELRHKEREAQLIRCLEQTTQAHFEAMRNLQPDTCTAHPRAAEQPSPPRATAGDAACEPQRGMQPGAAPSPAPDAGTWQPYVASHWVPGESPDDSSDDTAYCSAAGAGFRYVVGSLAASGVAEHEGAGEGVWEGSVAEQEGTEEGVWEGGVAELEARRLRLSQGAVPLKAAVVDGPRRHAVSPLSAKRPLLA